MAPRISTERAAIAAVAVALGVVGIVIPSLHHTHEHQHRATASPASLAAGRAAAAAAGSEVPPSAAALRVSEDDHGWDRRVAAAEMAPKRLDAPCVAPGGRRGADGECRCLAVWRGAGCDQGETFVLPKNGEPGPPRRLPAAYAGDLLSSKQNLKALPKGDVVVDLPGKQPALRTVAKAKTLMAVAPETDPLTGNRYASCAIVGNSGMLIYKRSGREIDAHDMVMRFNGAPTKGLEEHVGSKTTLRLVNSKWLEAAESPDELVLYNMRSGGAAEDYVKIRSANPKGHFHVFTPAFVGYLAQMAYSISHSFSPEDAPGFNSGDYTPTSGWNGLILAANLCENITLYGMMVSENQGVPYHYHNRCPQPYGERDEAEWLMFKRFVDAGIARFFEPCIPECHTSDEECSRCRYAHPEHYSEQAKADGQKVWERTPMPDYCANRAILLERERKHVAAGGSKYTVEERNKILMEIRESQVKKAPRKAAKKGGGSH